jgi:hypothetical protein
MGKLFTVGGNFLFGRLPSMVGERKLTSDVSDTLLTALALTSASELILSTEVILKPVRKQTAK